MRSNKKRNRKDKRERPGNGPKEDYQDIVKENADFEAYYKAQKIVADDEWDAFMASLREHLPVSFRITGCKSHAEALLKTIQGDYFNRLLQNEDTGIEKPICLPWYPNGLAWQINVSRKEVRKSETLKRLHNFLIHETDGGYISRQEAVSMIPPLLLDIQPHHKVFDMCAAPGSKTAQLIEMLHANNTALPEGIVIANDIDNKRCYMLVHQAKRLHSPCFIITNHDSANMPNIMVKQSDEKSSVLKFDRILCDVPCSGDGTLRKNYDVWRKWNTANGNNFHGLQSRIARRGLELLEVGGLMVYSTCSLNPMEDEAVIHRLLVECEGSVELQDFSAVLSGLKYLPGLSEWAVMSRDLTAYTDPVEVPPKYTTQIRPQMFPPKPEDREKFHLERCLRILPHHQNTGGFFVAVLKKVAPLPWENIVANPEPDANIDGNCSQSQPEPDNKSCSSPPRKMRRLHQGHKEDPFFFFNETETVWPQIKEFYDIDDTFDSTLLLTRCQTGKKRHVYLTSKAVKEIIVENRDRIKIINTGIKVFCRNDNKITKCDFRLTQEGIESVLPFIKNRRVQVDKNDMTLLLTTEFPFNTKMSQETRSQLQKLESGCIVLMHTLEASENSEPLTLSICGWKGATSVRAYIPKSEQVHYLRMIGVDSSRFEQKQAVDESTSHDDASTSSKNDNGIEHDVINERNLDDGETISDKTETLTS